MDGILPSTDDWEPLSDLIEDGQMPHFGIRLLSSLGADGKPRVDWALHGSQVQSFWAVGALITAAIEIFHQQLHEADE